MKRFAFAMLRAGFPIINGRATSNGTKIWITSAGKALLRNNDSKIPDKMLINIMKHVEANSELIIDKWCEQFGEISYYC